jgi:hypothetical protein
MRRPVAAPLIFGVAVCLCIPATRVCAEVDIKPGIGLRAVYDDNIFLSSSDRESDFITYVMPSLKLAAKTAELSLDTDYSLHYAFYSDHTELDETRLKDVQRAHSVFRAAPAGVLNGFSASVEHDYQRVTLDERKPSADGNDRANKTNRNLLRATPQFQADLGATGKALGSFRYVRTLYQSPLGDDRTEYGGRLQVQKDSPGFSRSAGLWGDASYADNLLSRDYAYREGRMFFEQAPPSGFSYRLDGGVGRLDPRAWEHTTAWVWSGRARMPVGENLNLGLGTGKGVTQGALDGAYDSRTADASLQWTRGIDATVRLTWEKDDYFFIRRVDDYRSLGLELAMPLGASTSAAAGGEYRRAHLEPGDERENRYSAHFDLRWVSGRVSAGLGYRYRSQGSTREEESYLGHTVSADLGYNF